LKIWLFKKKTDQLYGPPYTSYFVVAVVVAVVVVACLLVLYSLRQFDNLTLQQGSYARMQFCILPLQQGNSRHVHAVWYPATAAGQQPPRACSLVSCYCKWQFGILPLQGAVWYPATASGSLVSCHCSRAGLNAFSVLFLIQNGTDELFNKYFYSVSHVSSIFFSFSLSLSPKVALQSIQSSAISKEMFF
jgi:hypothetical protein